MKHGGRTGWKEGERRSHSSRSIGVPEVIGNDKVGKMREEPREGGKKWNGEEGDAAIQSMAEEQEGKK